MKNSTTRKDRREKERRDKHDDKYKKSLGEKHRERLERQSNGK